MGPQTIQFRAVVSQQELADIVARRAAIAFQMHTLLRSEESVLMRLVRGAEVQPGIHQAWLQEAVKGRMRKQILEVR